MGAQNSDTTHTVKSVYAKVSRELSYPFSISSPFGEISAQDNDDAHDRIHSGASLMLTLALAPFK